MPSDEIRMMLMTVESLRAESYAHIPHELIEKALTNEEENARDPGEALRTLDALIEIHLAPGGGA